MREFALRVRRLTFAKVQTPEGRFDAWGCVSGAGTSAALVQLQSPTITRLQSHFNSGGERFRQCGPIVTVAWRSRGKSAFAGEFHEGRTLIVSKTSAAALC